MILLSRKLSKGGDFMCKIVLGEDSSITIPNEILEELGIEVGDNVKLYVEDGCIVLERLEDAFIE